MIRIASGRFSPLRGASCVQIATAICDSNRLRAILTLKGASCVQNTPAFCRTHGFELHVSSGNKRSPLKGASFVTGGEGGIRTHGTRKRTPDFESGPFDHSGTSPLLSRLKPLPQFPAPPQFWVLPKNLGLQQRGTDCTQCECTAPEALCPSLWQNRPLGQKDTET